MLIIRRIHHFGYKVWLGAPERIKSYVYEKIDGELGPINIMTSKNQFIVPRQILSKSKSKVTLYNKRIYDVKENELLKEIVLVENQPKIIDYVVENHYSISDDGKGIKGYVNARKGENIVVF